MRHARADVLPLRRRIDAQREQATVVNPSLKPAPLAPDRAWAAVSSDWKQWIAENRLRDCSPPSMVETMAAAGVARNVASAAIAHVEADPVYLAASKHQQLLRKLESVVGNLQRVWELAPDYKTVEKRPLCSKGEFLERYLFGCRPLVFTDIAQATGRPNSAGRRPT